MERGQLGAVPTVNMLSLGLLRIVLPRGVNHVLSPTTDQAGTGRPAAWVPLCGVWRSARSPAGSELYIVNPAPLRMAICTGDGGVAGSNSPFGSSGGCAMNRGFDPRWGWAE